MMSENQAGHEKGSSDLVPEPESVSVSSSVAMLNPETIAEQFLQQMNSDLIRTFDETRINFVGGSVAQSAAAADGLSSQLCVSVQTGSDPSTIRSTFEVIHDRLHLIDNGNQEQGQGRARRRIRRISTICFRDYLFEKFPENVGGELFSEVSHCIIYNCPNLSSIGQILIQFPRLVSLDINFCPQFKSFGDFASLSHSPPLHLCFVKFDDCGLAVSSNNEQDWDDGMEGLSNIPGPIELIIKNCKTLASLPPSIEKLQNLHTLILDKLPNLVELPSTFGNLKSLALLSVVDVGLIKLPPEIGRLNFGCLVHFACSRLIYPPRCYRGSLRAMRKYYAMSRLKAFCGFVRLAILFRRARKRANERLFAPGGRGYKRVREHFTEMSNKQSKI